MGAITDTLSSHVTASHTGYFRLCPVSTSIASLHIAASPTLLNPEVRELGKMSVCTVLVTKAQGPKIDPQNLYFKEKKDTGTHL